MIKQLVYHARRKIDQPFVGYVLLALSVIIALSQVFYVYYNIGDEGDSLATGWLLANGWDLYKDLFSHHFPFSYLWIAVIVKLFGASLFAIRFSLILLRTLVLALSMKMSRFYLAIGLTSVAWSLVGHLYLGNSVVYQSFSGIFIVGGFAIGLSLVIGQEQERASKLFATGIFFGFAIMSDPLMSFPSIILLAVMAVSPISNSTSKNKLLLGSSRVITVAAGIMISIFPIFIYLISNDSLQYFYQHGILFNSQVYSNYAPPITLTAILEPVRRFLGLFDEQWRYYLSPFYEWTTFEFLDSWVFTGFFYRLAIILMSLALFVERKFLGAIFVYLFGAMVLIRSETFFHASPFVFFSLFCVSRSLSRGLRFLVKFRNNIITEDSGTSFPIGRNVLPILVWTGLLTAFVWLGFRGGKYLVDNMSELGYSQNFATVEGNAGFLKKATCGLDDARVLIYPLDPIQYFLAEIPPASKFHFLTPWAADIGQRQVVADLESGKILVYLNRGTNIWEYQVENYLTELLAFLDERYVLIEPNYYASPELLRVCPYEESKT